MPPMHSSPHPNQVRSACERCRRQKLRCSRPAAPDAICARCARLGKNCQPGMQRRIGRPVRKDLVPAETAPATTDVGVSVSVLDADVLVEASPVVGFAGGDAIGDIVADVPHCVDWMFPGDFSFRLGDANDALTAASGMQLLQDERWLSIEPESAIVLPTTQEHFATLSKINIELHRSWESLSTNSFCVGASFCYGKSSFIDLELLKRILDSVQDFLGTIKAMHRRLGTRDSARPIIKYGRPEREDSSTTTSTSPEDVHAQQSQGSFQTGSGCGLKSRNTIIDSHTAFLVISCYSQVIKHIELIATIVNHHLGDETMPLMGPAENMTLMGLNVVDFSSQVGLFTELVRNVVCQITLVLGLPMAPWSGRSVWTGLLREDRYREMLNQELGGPIQDQWTTRPAKLMEAMDETRRLVMEVSMMGYG
jgi:hypothetical protein